MKLIPLALCSVILACASLQASPLNPPGKAKITKNEAEHIALKHFPGARVTAAKLEKMHGTLVWTVEIVQEKSKPTMRVEVDAMTGHIIPGAKEKP